MASIPLDGEYSPTGDGDILEVSFGLNLYSLGEDLTNVAVVLVG